MPTGLNVTDPAAQAHLFHLLSQLQAPGAWGAANQASASPSLENLLAQISRQPEIAASLPGLLSTLTGGNLGGQQQQQQNQQPVKVDTNPLPAQLDAGQGSYTAQLYGTPVPG